MYPLRRSSKQGNSRKVVVEVVIQVAAEMAPMAAVAVAVAMGLRIARKQFLYQNTGPTTETSWSAP